MDYNNQTKDTLVNLAIERKLVASKNAARGIKRDELIGRLAEDDKLREPPRAVETGFGPSQKIVANDDGEIIKPNPEWSTTSLSISLTPEAQTVYSDYIKNNFSAPSTPPDAPKRLPHGAKTSAEVHDIKRYKKWRNQRRHRRAGVSWANGQTSGRVNGKMMSRAEFLASHPSPRS